jgi:uncharacterized protein (DUF305 family)
MSAQCFRRKSRAFASSFGVIALLALMVRAGSQRDTASVNGFQAMIAAAVARMHSGMDIPSTGDPDRDFARMMIPHHQGAIDMALAELRYGKDERLRRLAQEIIVEQQQEIAVMHRALGDLPPQRPPASTQVPAAGKEH